VDRVTPTHAIGPNRRALQALALVWMLCMPVWATANDTARHEAQCTQLTAPPALEGLGHEAASALQERLREIYRNDRLLRTHNAEALLADGVIGPVTRTWLQRFCLEFAVPGRNPAAGGLAEAVVRFSGILARHPNWRKELLSAELGRWIAARPETERVSAVTSRLFGADPEVERLLAAFEADGRPEPQRESNDLALFYELTTKDLERLTAPRTVLEGLGKMQDKPALAADPFDAAVTALLVAANLAPDRYLPIVRRHAETRAVQQITAEVIQDLRVRRLPPAAIALAQTLQDLPFPDRKELAAALEDARQAASDAALEVAPGETPKVAAPAAASPQTPAQIDPAAKPESAALPVAPETPPVPAIVAAPAPAPAPRPQHLGPALNEITKASVERLSYRITGATLAALEADGDFGALPAFVLGVLADMENVEYPSEALYRAAVHARMVQTFLRDPVSSAPDRTLKSMADVKKTGAPPAFLAAIENVAAADHASSRELRDRLAAALEPLTAPFFAPIEAAARKFHPLRQAKVIDWQGGNCGCVLPSRLPGGGSILGGRTYAGIVYGLFPVWQAGHPQIIDFSVLSSVGYFAVPFDDTGNLHDPLEDFRDDDRRFEFVDTAHRHGVRVDWIIRRVDWSSWVRLTPEKQAVAFANLVQNIDAMLRESPGHWLRRLASRLSFGAIPAPRRGDGVTLHFDNYPEDDASVAAFTRFHQQLTSRLRDSIGEASAVNLLLPASSLGTGIHRCDRLLDLLYGPGGDKPSHEGKFLIFIPEPSIDSKKDLRQQIENCASGSRRKDLQQSIVPVIQYDGYSESQLRDDVIYFDFNFGGVGLWPHPVASDAPATDGADDRVTVEQVGGDVRDILLGTSGKPGTLERVGTGICDFVCPNRWVFRGLFEAFLVVLLVSVVVRWANCSLNFALKARPIYFYLYMAAIVAPTLALFIALLYCDPAWEDVREGNVPFLLLAVAFIGYVIWLYVKARREASKP